MKNDFEMYQSVLSRRDEYRRKKEKRTRIIRHTAAVTLGTAAVLVIGIATQVMKPPRKPEPQSSGIITDTSTQTTVTTESEQSPVQTEAVCTSTSSVDKKEAVTATFTEVFTTSINNTTLRNDNTSAVTVPSATTSLFSTATNKVTTTSSETTNNTASSTFAPETTTLQAITTTNIGQPATTTMVSDYDGMLAQNFNKLQLFDNGTEYFIVKNDIASSRIGKKLTETTVAPTLYVDFLPDTVRAEVYEIDDISSAYLVGVRFEGSERTRGFVNVRYQPNTLGDLIDDLNMKNDVTFNGAYIDTYDHTHTTIYYNVDSEKLLSIFEENRDSLMIPDYTLSGRILGNISVSLPITGLENVSIRIMDDGCFTTNLTPYGSSFYIGKENTSRLLDCLYEK